MRFLFLFCGFVLLSNASAQTVTLTGSQQVSERAGGLVGTLNPTDFDIFSYAEGIDFGASLALVGDIDGNGFPDLLGGGSGASHGGTRNGAAYLLYMGAGGVPIGGQAFDGVDGLTSALDLPLGGLPLAAFDFFGSATANIGDLDNDGFPEFAFGVRGEGNGGGIYIGFTKANGTLRTTQLIAEGAGGFVGTLANVDQFGSSIARLGDIDADGIEDLAVGAPGDDANGSNAGAVYVLRLNANGTVKAQTKLLGPYAGAAYGSGLDATFLDGDGIFDLIVGATGLFGLAQQDGGLIVEYLNANGTSKDTHVVSQDGLGADGDEIGSSVAVIDDLDGNGVPEWLVGARGYEANGGFRKGAAFVLFMASNETVSDIEIITEGEGGFAGTLDAQAQLGYSVADAGFDYDDDGRRDIVVGAYAARDGGLRRGALYLLALDENGQVVDQMPIHAEANSPVTLQNDYAFAEALASLGDLDGDTITDLAVGVPGHDYEHENAGSVWVLRLNADGTVKADQQYRSEIHEVNTTNGFPAAPPIEAGDQFGASLTSLGEFLPGFHAIVAGTPGADGAGTDRGGFRVLHRAPAGFINQVWTYDTNTHGGVGQPFAGVGNNDELGSAVAALGDIDNDGIEDLAVSAPLHDLGGSNRGGVWVLRLNADGSIKAWTFLGHNAGGFGTLDDDDRFGSALAGVADVNSDGVEDLVVGAAGDDDGGPQRGAVYVLFLTQTGTVSGFQKISQTSGGFGLSLNNLGGFGSAIESIGDQDGNGVPDLAIGASAAPGSGRAFVAFLDAAGTSLNAVEIPEAALALGDRFGAGLAFLGDLGADGDVELAVGAPAHDEGGRNRGAFWTYSLDINPPLAAGVTAWLWGADAGTGSLMRADLAAAGLLPAAQPYNATPWSYAGSESVASHSARSVDWVLVRLYAENTPDEIAASAAGMLDTTGSVRDAVTNEALRFNVSPGPYYVSIEHRNHKPVRTAQPVLFDTFAEVDFTLSETSAGVNASYETPYGFYALWPGNSIGSATLDALDALDWRLMAGQSSVYTRADFNLDGDVDAADLLGLWLPANGR